jgi:hypothetical protein
MMRKAAVDEQCRGGDVESGQPSGAYRALPIGGLHSRPGLYLTREMMQADMNGPRPLPPAPGVDA